MIRVAQFSDIHYAGNTLQEVERCFTFAVDEAIKQGVACAVISGDSTDHALDVHAPAVNALARNIRRLADHCPVLMLQGTFSHEPPGTLNVFRLLGGKYPVHVADTIEQVALMSDGSWQASENWCFEEIPAGALALFSCVPTVNKAVIAAVAGATNAAESVGEELACLLKGFVPINEAARLSGIPTIGVSHGTVYGCMTEHGVPMAGFDHEFSTATLFSTQTSAFMLGHIHKHQSWEEGGRIIAYPGSIGRLHYGEEGDKGFLIWEVDAAAAQCKLVRTPAKRTVEITFDGLPTLEVLQEQVERLDIDGAYVRVRWTAPEEDRHQVDRAAITEALRGAASIKLEGRLIPVVRTRAAGISLDASIKDKIATWAKATEAKAAPLLACLETLQTSTPEEIAARLIQHSIHDSSEKRDKEESLSRSNERGLNHDSMEAMTLF
ncbi:MAG: metallophosphatase family protein [Pseudomonadota bacterium]